MSKKLTVNISTEYGTLLLYSPTLLQAEEDARIAADTAEANARIAGDATEENSRIAADTAEANARIAADTAEASARIAADALKADNDSVVHITGNETIDGVKTFNASPIVPIPTIGAQAANKAYVDSLVVDGISVGDIKYNSKSATFTGWLACDGSAVSRTSYADLFDGIGTLYGAGDGSTTFNLPDFRGQFLRGCDDGTLTAAVGTKQLSAAPNITGNFRYAVNPGAAITNYPVAGAFAYGTYYNSAGGGGGGTANNSSQATFNASRSNAAYGRDSTTEVRPTNFAVYMYIKY